MPANPRFNGQRKPLSSPAREALPDCVRALVDSMIADITTTRLVDPKANIQWATRLAEAEISDYVQRYWGSDKLVVLAEQALADGIVRGFALECWTR